MAARRSPELSPGEWAVLGAVAEGPTYGFAVAQLFVVEATLGQVWTLPRPVVYQILKKLARLELIGERRTERSSQGPSRTIIEVTPMGRRAVRRWLAEPVDHIRDVRSALLLKLALLDRIHGDRRPLVEAQLERLSATLERLEIARQNADGFEMVVAEWRLASAKATAQFLAAIGE